MRKFIICAAVVLSTLGTASAAEAATGHLGQFCKTHYADYGYSSPRECIAANHPGR